MTVERILAQELGRVKSLDAVNEAYAEKLEAEELLTVARLRFRQAIFDAVEAGVSVAELSRILGISRQRVRELVNKHSQDEARIWVESVLSRSDLAP